MLSFKPRDDGIYKHFACGWYIYCIISRGVDFQLLINRGIQLKGVIFL